MASEEIIKQLEEYQSLKVYSLTAVKNILQTLREAAYCLHSAEQQLDVGTMEDKVRVLRIIEYVGDRRLVEQQIATSIHGEKVIARGALTLRATTLGTFPEILNRKQSNESVK